MRGKIGKRSSQALSTKALNHPCSRKTLPCSKGIETVFFTDWIHIPRSKDPALFQRDWDVAVIAKTRLAPSKDPALFQRDWDRNLHQSWYIDPVERPRPVPKGLRHLALLSFPYTARRKTPPCSKGIETFTSGTMCYYANSRKTPPCSKGIETFRTMMLDRSLRRKTLPCYKGIETQGDFIIPSRFNSRKTLPCYKGIET